MSNENVSLVFGTAGAVLGLLGVIAGGTVGTLAYYRQRHINVNNTNRLNQIEKEQEEAKKERANLFTHVNNLEKLLGNMDEENSRLHNESDKKLQPLVEWQKADGEYNELSYIQGLYNNLPANVDQALESLKQKKEHEKAVGEEEEEEEELNGPECFFCNLTKFIANAATTDIEANKEAIRGFFKDAENQKFLQIVNGINNADSYLCGMGAVVNADFSDESIDQYLNKLKADKESKPGDNLILNEYKALIEKLESKKEVTLNVIGHKMFEAELRLNMAKQRLYKYGEKAAQIDAIQAGALQAVQKTTSEHILSAVNFILRELGFNSEDVTALKDPIMEYMKAKNYEGITPSKIVAHLLTEKTNILSEAIENVQNPKTQAGLFYLIAPDVSTLEAKVKANIDAQLSLLKQIADKEADIFFGALDAKLEGNVPETENVCMKLAKEAELENELIAAVALSKDGEESNGIKKSLYLNHLSKRLGCVEKQSLTDLGDTLTKYIDAKKGKLFLVEEQLMNENEFNLDNSGIDDKRNNSEKA